MHSAFFVLLVYSISTRLVCQHIFNVSFSKFLSKNGPLRLSSCESRLPLEPQTTITTSRRYVKNAR